LISKADLVSIEEWLNTLRIHLNQMEPALQDIFEIYAAEAKFGRSFIDADLKKLQDCASILEVGAGSMILSCQLAMEGFAVTALEPSGVGFSHFSKLRSIVLEQASKIGGMPKMLLLPAEELVDKNQYDFAFSINVMEHVENVACVVDRVAESLHPAGVYHFTCPNYLFPYEPHFNIPIILNKKITSILFHKTIVSNGMPDPLGTWSSLNWISILKLNKIAKENKNFRMKLNKNLISETIERALTDVCFANRRSSWMKVILIFIVKIKCHKLLRLFPAVVQPIIDCEIISLR